MVTVLPCTLSVILHSKVPFTEMTCVVQMVENHHYSQRNDDRKVKKTNRPSLKHAPKASTKMRRSEQSLSSHDMPVLSLKRARFTWGDAYAYATVKVMESTMTGKGFEWLLSYQMANRADKITSSCRQIDAQKVCRDRVTRSLMPRCRIYQWTGGKSLSTIDSPTVPDIMGTYYPLSITPHVPSSTFNPAKQLTKKPFFSEA